MGRQQTLREFGSGLTAIIVLLMLGHAVPAQAQEKVDQMTVEAGGQLVTELCGRCHTVAVGQPSPHPQAPSMRHLARRYPVERLAEALAEGMMVGHPDMPVFEFDVGEVDQIISYLNSIQDP